MLTGALSYLFPGLLNVNDAAEGGDGSSGADGRRQRRRRTKGKETSNGNATRGGEYLGLCFCSMRKADVVVAE